MARMVKKKKKNYRLRKSVRRTLGALFMISAIIVAAIPFPDAAATNGDPLAGGGGSQNNGNTSAEISYSVAMDTSINNKDNNGGIDLSKEGNKYSYNVFMRNNQWIYQWQFAYYDAATNIGIISDYNGEYQVETIKLLDTINEGYVAVDESTYVTYYSSSGGGNTPLTLTYEDRNSASDRAPFEKYFKDQLDDFDDLVLKYDTQL